MFAQGAYYLVGCCRKGQICHIWECIEKLYSNTLSCLANTNTNTNATFTTAFGNCTLMHYPSLQCTWMSSLGHISGTLQQWIVKTYISRNNCCRKVFWKHKCKHVMSVIETVQRVKLFCGDQLLSKYFCGDYLLPKFSVDTSFSQNGQSQNTRPGMISVLLQLCNVCSGN